MDVREKLVELLGEVQETGVNEIPAGFGCTSQYITNEIVAAHLISHGVTVQEWISVDERLPEEKVNCIVYYKHAFCEDENHGGISVCFYDGDEFQMDFAHKVTHWMPITQPPKGE